MLFRTLLLSGLVLLFIACDKKKSPAPALSLMEQRSLQLANLDANGGTPNHVSFADACAQLLQLTETFAQDQSLSNLEALRSQWKITAELFKRCELYKIGDVSNSFIHYPIYRWPINSDILEDSLSTSTQVNEVYISTLGSHLVGLGSIEFILFERDASSTLDLLLAEPKRMDFLVEVTRYLSQLANDLDGIWANYSPSFVLATESGLNGGQNQMINSLVFFLEEASKVKLGKPLGETNGGIPDSTFFEAHRSRHSLALMRVGFDEWKHCYNGEFPGSTDNYGFDDYLESLDRSDLVEAIQNGIDNVDSALASLSFLEDDLTTANSKVVALQNTYSELSVLFKTDLASAIGATITVNDTDGD